MSDRYLQPEIETMPRAGIEALQEEKLLDLLPYVYERSALYRTTWDAAGVHPREIRSIDDFRARVPFIDKDTVRAFRDDHRDPYGGLLCIDEADLHAVLSTSGTTGDPTLVPERWDTRFAQPPLSRELWELGVRDGDYVAFTLFTFRGPIYAAAQHIGGVPVFFDHSPREMERFVRLSLELRPVIMYNLSNILVAALADLAPKLGADMRDVFSSYRAVIYGGEPLGTRALERIRAWGLTMVEHTSVGDAGAATECRERAGAHFWEDMVLVEHLDPDGAEAVADGARGEPVVTGLNNLVAPLVRFRSDDLAEITRAPCRCGRTHGRIRPLGRKGDEVVVGGRSVHARDVWAAIEAVEETGMGLFQIIRRTRVEERLRLRVGHDGSGADTAALAERVGGAVRDAVGVEPEIELVPNDDLLRLGPPHKIPRVAKA